jgi:fluoride exporter
VSAPVLLTVAVLGGLGAVGRFLVDGMIAGRLGREFPFGTLAVNLSGTLALGILIGAAVSDDALRLAGTGLLGSYTTFSTWALESHRLGEDGERAAAALNFAASLVLGVGIAWIAQQVGAAL